VIVAAAAAAVVVQGGAKETGPAYLVANILKNP